MYEIGRLSNPCDRFVLGRLFGRSKGCPSGYPFGTVRKSIILPAILTAGDWDWATGRSCQHIRSWTSVTALLEHQWRCIHLLGRNWVAR